MEQVEKIPSCNFTCDVCGAVKRDSFDLRAHALAMHSGERAPYTCQRYWCAENFPTKWDRKQHMESCKIYCTEPGCPKSHIGMVWRRVVNQHKSKHETLKKKLVASQVVEE